MPRLPRLCCALFRHGRLQISMRDASGKPRRREARRQHTDSDATESAKGEPDVSSRGSARRRRGHLHAVHQGAGRRRRHRAGRRERPGTAHRRPRAGRESDPEQWWEALCEALRQCGRRGARGRRGLDRRPAARPGHAGRAGRPVRPALLWNDVRSAPQARPAGRGAGRPEGLGGADRQRARRRPSPSPSGPGSRENEPEAAARHRGRPAAPRLPHRAADRDGTTDRGDASGTGWWASGTEAYDEEILGRVGLDPALLPRVVCGPARRPGPYGTAGPAASPRAPWWPPAPATTWPRPSGSGCARGAGAQPRHLRHRVRGLATPARGPHRDGRRLRRRPRRLAAAGLHPQLHARRRPGRRAAGPGPGGGGAGRLVPLLPFLDGERTPNLPHASGLLHGLRHDTTPGQLLQAAYDGAVFTLLTALDQVLDADAAPDTPLLLIGGGAKGTAWRETVRRLSGRPVQVPRAAGAGRPRRRRPGRRAGAGRGPGGGGAPLGDGGGAVVRGGGARRGDAGAISGYCPTRTGCCAGPEDSLPGPCRRTARDGRTGRPTRGDHDGGSATAQHPAGDAPPQSLPRAARRGRARTALPRVRRDPGRADPGRRLHAGGRADPGRAAGRAGTEPARQRSAARAARSSSTSAVRPGSARR